VVRPRFASSHVITELGRSTDLTQPGLASPTYRADLTRQLLEHVERLSPLLGTVPLATEFQLLKRDFSRGHGGLRAAGESNFPSVVTLVESALACLTRKDHTPAVLDALREAFTAGARQKPFTFHDYDAVRRRFEERDILVVPTIDLDTLAPQDFEDAGEG
jgi:hypothetical protein